MTCVSKTWLFINNRTLTVNYRYLQHANYYNIHTNRITIIKQASKTRWPKNTILLLQKAKFCEKLAHKMSEIIKKNCDSVKMQ